MLACQPPHAFPAVRQTIIGQLLTCQATRTGLCDLLLHSAVAARPIVDAGRLAQTPHVRSSAAKAVQSATLH